MTATNHLHIGRRWDERRESWVGFVASLCLNDPGALADRRRLISSVRRDIACCDVQGNCYHNLVATAEMAESSGFVAIFHDQTNQTSSVCQFGTSQLSLADLFSETNYAEKRKTTVNGKVANLADCQIYEEMARGDAHQVLSDFSTGDNVLSDTFYQQSIIPQRHGQVSNVAIESKGSSGSVVALIYSNRIEKFSVTKSNKWLWNIELYSSVAHKAKSVALFNDNLYVLNDRSLEVVDMANCAYYQAEATCLIVSDVTCGWNPLDAQCQRTMEPNSNPQLIKEKSQIEIQSQIVLKKAALDGTITLVADTSEDIYDSLEWLDPSQQRLVENETPMYTWFVGANKTQLLVYDTSAYLVNDEKLQFTLHYNIRNETTKMIIFEINHDRVVPNPATVPMIKSDQLEGATSLGSIVPAIITIVALVVIAIIIAICIMVSRALPNRRRRRGSSKLNSGSKQASILDSDQSFILHAPDMHNLYERERTGRFEYNMQLTGMNNSKPDQESFKSDYMSCSSKDLSSANSEPEQYQMPQPDEAIIVFPDGTIGRLKATKLKNLKVSLLCSKQKNLYFH